MSRVKITLCIIGAIIFFAIEALTKPLSLVFDKWWNNKVNYAVQKVDDNTNYETIKKVEDTCRAMIASYKTDKSTYEQYKYSTNSEKQGWGEQAKMRANKTANIYNEYILKNSFVWRDNVPKDIYTKLGLLE